MTPYQEGYEAYEKGMVAKDNPYWIGYETIDSFGWSQGFLTAYHHDMEDKDRMYQDYMREEFEIARRRGYDY